MSQRFCATHSNSLFTEQSEASITLACKCSLISERTNCAELAQYLQQTPLDTILRLSSYLGPIGSQEQQPEVKRFHVGAYTKRSGILRCRMRDLKKLAILNTGFSPSFSDFLMYDHGGAVTQD